jgi:hypothetical protein
MLDDTLIYLHRRRQRRLSRGHAQRHLQRDELFQRRLPRWRRPSSSRPRRSTNSAARSPTITTPSAGRTPWTRPTSGPSRSPRTGAARATAPSCTGPRASRPRARFRSQFHHVIDVAPTVLEAAGLPQPTSVNGIQQDPIEGVSMLLHLQRRQAAERHDDAVLRDVRQPRHLPQGLDRGDASTLHALDHGAAAPPSTTTSGNSTPTTTGARRTTWPQRCPEKLAELQRLFLIEARKYNVLPLDDRRRTLNPTLPGRPTLIKGKTQLLFGGMGRLSRTACSTSRTSRTR